MNKPRCPVCNSKKVRGNKNSFRCLKCEYQFDINTKTKKTNQEY